MKRHLKRALSVVKKGGCLGDERGLSTVEYVIILVLVAAASVGLWVNFGGTLKKKLGAANDEISDHVKINASSSEEGSGDGFPNGG